MIKHIVCYKLREFTAENIEKAKSTFFSMRGNVPQVISVDVYVDELRSERSFDVMLEVVLDSFEALEEYQRDVFHVEQVKKVIHGLVERSVSLDFNVQ